MLITDFSGINLILVNGRVKNDANTVKLLFGAYETIECYETIENTIKLF